MPELPEARPDILREQAGSPVAKFQPRMNGRGHFPEDTIVVEGQFVAVGKELQRGEFPPRSFGHAIVEVRFDEPRHFAGRVVPDHFFRHVAGLGAGAQQRNGVHANRVGGVETEDIPGAPDGKPEGFKARLGYTSATNPCCRSASNNTSAAQFDKLSDRDSALNIGIRNQRSGFCSSRLLGSPAVSRPNTR